MQRKQIEIVELDRHGSQVGPFASARQAERFADAVEKVAGAWKQRLGLPTAPLQATANGDAVVLVASGVTGVVPIDDYDAIIIPKYLAYDSSRHNLWSAALLRMLSHAASNRFIIEKEVSAAVSPHVSFIDLLGYSYAQNLAAALEEGIPRGYRQITNWQQNLRGRLVVERLYPAILAFPDRVPCAYTEYVIDTPVARLLKWGALEFASLVSRAFLADRLASLAALLPNVPASLPPLLMLERLRLSPQYRHCEPALLLALWLARERGGQAGKGKSSLPGLLLDSASVFEDFVVAALKGACRSRPWRFRRTRLTLAEPISAGKGIPTEPDAQIWDKDNAVLVVDAKYKMWGGVPKASNAYQVMADARLLSCKRTVLIYPSPSGTCPAPIHWRINEEGNPRLLSAVFLDPLGVVSDSGFAALVRGLGADLDKVLSEAA